MKINIKKIVLFFLFFGCIAVFSHKYFFKRWSSYYHNKLYKEPRQLLVQGIDLFNKSNQDTGNKKALDLGAGVGNDTVYLLQQGWYVWTNDKEKEAIGILKSRKDIQEYLDNVTFINKDFLELPWNQLPLFNIIYAAYSLPFIDKTNFYIVWNNILDHLESNGLLIVYLLGDMHEGFNAWQKSKMSFFNKKEVLELFKDLDIIFFEETYERNDQHVMDHSFAVIATKKL